MLRRDDAKRRIPPVIDILNGSKSMLGLRRARRHRKSASSGMQSLPVLSAERIRSYDRLPHDR